MAGAQTSLTLTDRLTGPLTRMMKAMDRTISIMEKMDRTANNVNTKGLQRARSDIQSASAELERLKASVRLEGSNTGIERLQNQFTNLPGPIRAAGGAVRNFFAGFAGAAAAYLSLEAIINGFRTFVNSADNYVSTSARLENINDGLQTQVELQQMVYEAAQRSRSGYMDLASSVSKLGLLADDAFKDNKEMVAFGEMMGKVFTVSGASTFERQAGMYQLTQAMAAGKLQGDEFRSIMENAPMLAQAIADFTGKTKGQLKEMSADGTITADVIKGALFNAADDIEKKFKNMPLTFGQAWTMFSNWATRAFEPLFIRFNQFVNSDAFGVLAGHAMWFINIFIAGMDLAFDTLEWFYNTIAAVGQFFSDNWAIIAPILTVIGAALGALGIILLAHAAKWAIVAVATKIAKSATWGYIAAMLANPTTWIIMGIVAAIAILIYALITWSDQTATVIGFIAGLFTALGAGIWNVFVYVWNFIMSFVEFLLNVFIDPVYAVKKLFYDLSKNVIDFMSSIAGSFDNVANVLGNAFVTGANIAIKAVNWVIEALKKIPGISIDTMKELSPQKGSVLSDKIKNLSENLKPPERTKGTVEVPRLDFINVPDAASAAYDVGKSFSKSASDSLTKMADKISGTLKGPKGLENPFAMSPGESMLNSLDKGLTNPTGGKLDKVGKIDDKINIDEEDLKMLRELADIRSIQNFITLTPQVTFGDMTIREEVDVDKIVAKTLKGIDDMIDDEMNRGVKGAYS
ncbi:tape measure domain [Schinkia azotoformans MEV2011]|uniref:Tape measure domain n=1 Tax=Schinkia azotoformans MEV2011 TaxID=1348973 RepID=A0A072P4J7_SCHAZ|nr:tape measure protein [Schinkia azotoformans]KEF40405.1 tape measure domain [Schinkia azotoformans MEV2011]MEC1696184.1 tape measure protein [Schinkia azotoformans]MEC1725313.1 tape measure protein [Schinkia azotoformans]MEC1779424.1 tape measure protein [Schinkia azotoformans]MED4330091.1 tape measure protein [Schinkia azotoformans]